MKAVFFILGLVGITLLTHSCHQEVPEKLTIIEGVIKNSHSTEAFLLGNLKAPGKIKLDKDGLFRDTLDIDKDGYFITQVNRKTFPLFIKKGTTNSITLDLQDENPRLILSGGNQSIADYLAIKQNTTDRAYLNIPGFFGKEPIDFKKQLDSVFSTLKNELSKLAGEEEFKKLERQSLKIEEVQLYFDYPNYYKYVHKLEEYDVPQEIKDVFDNLDKDNELYASSFETYRNIVSNVIMNEAYEKGGDAGMIDEVIQILKHKKSPSLRNAVVNNVLNFFNPTDNVSIIKDNLITLTSNDKTKESIAERFNKIKDLIKGKPSPTFDYENFIGGNTSLKDFKGKYVYIDVWATWCGPCIGEIPSLKKLEHQYKDKNIAFVSISVDQKREYDTWRKMVTNKELGGSQLMADNNFKSKFIQDYAISAIPRFILLDPNGDIVSADAQRPSDKNLSAKFIELGIK